MRSKYKQTQLNIWTLLLSLQIHWKQKCNWLSSSITHIKYVDLIWSLPRYVNLTAIGSGAYGQVKKDQSGQLLFWPMLSKSKPLKIVLTFIPPAQVCSAEDTSLRSADGKFIKVAQIANCQQLDNWTNMIKFDKILGICNGFQQQHLANMAKYGWLRVQIFLQK